MENAQLRVRQIKALSKWEKLSSCKDLEGLTNLRGAKPQVGAVMGPKANDIWELEGTCLKIFFFLGSLNTVL